MLTSSGIIYFLGNDNLLKQQNKKSAMRDISKEKPGAMISIIHIQ